MNLRLLVAAVEVGLMVLLTHGLAAAAEIKVLSAVAMRAALDDLAPQFERTTSHKLTISYAVAGELRKRIEAANSEILRFCRDPGSNRFSRRAR